MTTVTIRLRDQTARALAARAAHEGRSLDALIADLAEQGAASPFDNLVALLAPLPLLNPEALSRDSIYGEPAGRGEKEAP